MVSGSGLVHRDNEFLTKAKREHKEKGVKPKKWFK